MAEGKYMVKITLLAMTFDGIENMEVGGYQSYLSENGYQVESIYLNGNEDVNQHFSQIDLSSKIYSMSIYSESSVYPESLLSFAKLAKKIKENAPDSIIVLAGKYSSIYFKEILKDERFVAVDYVILGDGEYSLRGLVDCVEAQDDVAEMVKEHKNIAARDSLEGKEFFNIDVNDLPLPDRSFLLNSNRFLENYYAFIYNSHGCYMKCAFCTRGQFYKKWTGRTAQSIFDEIKTITTTSSIKCFWFTGGSFEDPGGKKGIDFITEFCNLILADNLKVTMRCYLRSNFIVNVDVELLKLMKKAGFDVVLIGVEAANEFDLKLYNKATTIENNRIALKKLKEAGIYSDHYGFIMVNPYSTEERLRDNFLFLEEHQPHDLDNYVHHVVADPGTAIRKRLEEDGLLIPEDDFLKQGLSYRFVEPFTADVSKFLRKHFLIFDTETAGIPTFIHHFLPFISEAAKYEERLGAIMKKRSRMYSDYFRGLYIQQDIGLCERKYDEFMGDFKNYQKELSILQNKMIRDLIKNNIM